MSDNNWATELHVHVCVITVYLHNEIWNRVDIATTSSHIPFINHVLWTSSYASNFDIVDQSIMSLDTFRKGQGHCCIYRNSLTAAGVCVSASLVKSGHANGIGGKWREPEVARTPKASPEMIAIFIRATSLAVRTSCPSSLPSPLHLYTLAPAGFEISRVLAQKSRPHYRISNS